MLDYEAKKKAILGPEPEETTYESNEKISSDLDEVLKKQHERDQKKAIADYNLRKQMKLFLNKRKKNWTFCEKLKNVPCATFQ